MGGIILTRVKGDKGDTGAPGASGASGPNTIATASDYPDAIVDALPISYGLAIGRGLCVAPIGLRSHVVADSTQVSSATSRSQTYRQFWPLSDPKATCILPVLNNPFNYTGGQTLADTDAPNPITVAIDVEDASGNKLPFMFGGNPTVIIPSRAGVLVLPDAPIVFGAQVNVACNWGLGTLKGVWLNVYVSIPASRTDSGTTVTNGSPTVLDASIVASDQGRPVSGTGIPSNAFVATVSVGVSFTLGTKTSSGFASLNANGAGDGNVTISSQFPINYGSIIANGDQTNGANGADLTGYGSAVCSGSNAALYGPAMLLGPTPSGRKPIIAGVNDSIFNGTSDSSIGPLQRACINLGLPLVKAGKFGDFAQAISTPNLIRARRQTIQGAHYAIVQIGTNDGIDSTPKITNLKTYLTAIGQWLVDEGIKPILCTIMPRGSSIDGFTTLNGQTPMWPPANCASINSWVRGVPSPFVDYFDLSDLVSSARDSGYFAIGPNARVVTDMATTNGSKIITSLTANFSSADVGTGIYIVGTNYTSGAYTIASVQSSTQATTSTNCNATVSNAVAGIGAFYGSWDGTHPGAPLTIGAIKTALQALLATLTI